MPVICAFSRRAGRLLAALSVLSIALSAAPAARADDAAIQAAIQKELDNPALAHGWTGVMVKSLADSRVVFSQNADRLFIPASNMKLLVSSCCVDTLPIDFRYTTPVMYSGTLRNGVLTGALYLKGSGDSTLELKDLQELANAVKAAGITRVDGDVIGDGSIFDNRRLGFAWEWDDLAAYYSAEIDGLTVDRGTVAVTVAPGKLGQPPVVTLTPDAGYMLVRNAATTVPDSDEQTMIVDRPLAANIITITGNVKVGAKPDIVPVTLEEPAVYTAFVFRKLLRDEGITVTGTAHGGVTPGDAVQIAAHTSPALPEILRLLNKPSDNLIAESLLKTLGSLKKGKGSAEAGAEVEREYLKKIGANPDDVVIADGSGLSRLDLISPETITRILSYMWTHPNRDAFINSLPVAGVDGSLRNRMKNTPAQGKVLGKTGYVGKARNLSGYVYAKDGEPYAFSLLMNHYNGETSAVNTVQDHICEILAGSAK